MRLQLRQSLHERRPDFNIGHLDMTLCPKDVVFDFRPGLCGSDWPALWGRGMLAAHMRTKIADSRE